MKCEYFGFSVFFVVFLCLCMCVCVIFCVCVYFCVVVFPCVCVCVLLVGVHIYGCIYDSPFMCVCEDIVCMCNACVPVFYNKKSKNRELSLQK